jgi:hypothetical protein
VHTEATPNVYVQLVSATRVLDTRQADLRTNIINPSGNLDGHGRLLRGAVIGIKLDSLVYFAEAVFGNVTVTQTAAAGFVIVWSGATSSIPNISTVNFGADATLSNFFSSGVSDDAPTANNVVAIYAEETTHVILDVAGFALPGFEYLMPGVEPATSASSRNSRLSRAQAAMRRELAAERNGNRS